MRCLSGIELYSRWVPLYYGQLFHKASSHYNSVVNPFPNGHVLS